MPNSLKRVVNVMSGGISALGSCSHIVEEADT